MKKLFLLMVFPLFLSACSLPNNEIPNDSPATITIPDSVVDVSIDSPVDDIPIIDNELPPSDLEDQIAELFVAKYNYSLDQVEVTVNAYDAGGFARGMVALDGGGPGNEGGYLAALTADGWELVWDGNGMWDCDLINSYGFPEEIAPDCYEIN